MMSTGNPFEWIKHLTHTICNIVLAAGNAPKTLLVTRKKENRSKIEISKWQLHEIKGHNCNLFCTSFFSLATSKALRYKSTLKECGSKDWSLDSINLFLAASSQKTDDGKKTFTIKQSYIEENGGIQSIFHSHLMSQPLSSNVSRLDFLISGYFTEKAKPCCLNIHVPETYECRKTILVTIMNNIHLII